MAISTTWAAETRTYLNGDGSDRNTVMWSWCGEADTSDPADIDIYLNLRRLCALTFLQLLSQRSGHVVAVSAVGRMGRGHTVTEVVRIKHAAGGL